MKRVLTLMVLALFAAPLVGCHASADIEGDDDDTSYKKETTYKKTDDGTKTTKTETKVEN